MRKFCYFLFLVQFWSSSKQQVFIPFFEEDLEPVQIVDVRNDRIVVLWRLPDDAANMTARQRLEIKAMKTSTQSERPPMTYMVDVKERQFTFGNLIGNTTYRVSVEAFSDDASLWYGSNMATTLLAALDWLPPPSDLLILDKTNESLEISWSLPDASTGHHHVVINQYFINIYEFYPSSQTFTKKITTNVPIPKMSYVASKLNPGSVYNITVQAGTTYGYGSVGWTATSTLPTDEAFVLRQKSRSPNTLSVSWPGSWMSTPNAKFTIRARTIHSNDGAQKEILETGFLEAGRSSEFLMKHLSPGSTYNVSLTTAAQPEKAPAKWGKTKKTKTTWAVFSTLVQGEYSLTEARVAAESDFAASIVFQPLNVHAMVSYQIRYAPIDKDSIDPIIETRELHDDDLKCPKFGCEWKCFLVFNLRRRPREYTFSVRAKVDGVWNKWTPVHRREWNLLERVCSIGPPSAFVEHIGNEDHQRLVDMHGAQMQQNRDAWRFLVVVDSRKSKVVTIDITKLADKATADFNHVPFYIAASLTPEEVEKAGDFRIGDGRVYGGYLNYPLKDPDVDPQWTLIPMGQQENEIVEPRLRSCGFTEHGYKCDMSLSEVLSYVPEWLKVALTVVFVVSILICCLRAVCCCRKLRSRKAVTKETSLLYYHDDSPHHSVVTQEYRRVEQREFGVDDLDERRQFAEYLE